MERHYTDVADELHNTYLLFPPLLIYAQMTPFPTEKKKKVPRKKINKELNLGSIAVFQSVGPNSLVEVNSI